MENLKNFLAIINLIKFIKSAYKWIQNIRQNPEKARQDLRYYIYHVKSLKYMLAFIVFSSLIVFYFNILVFGLFWLKFNLEMKGFNFGLAYLIIFTFIPFKSFYNIYKDHVGDVKRYNSNYFHIS
jgi:hypothetical protein